MRFPVPRPFRSGRRTAGVSTFRPQLETPEGRWVPTNLTAGFVEFPVATVGSVTAMNFSPAGNLFIAQQGGQLRVYNPYTWTLQTSPFVTVNTTSVGERGLLGVTFDPRWWDGQNHCYVYVYYTVPTAPIHNRISRFLANSCENPTAAVGNQQIILELSNLSTATNHNGGGIQFGTDGMMYVGVGENATPSFAQNVTNLHGKVLRINAANFPGSIIPPDNPLIGVSGAREEIFANGYRNPFSLAVHPSYGWIFVNDVGQSGATRREEINFIDEYGYNFYSGYGGNYGWPVREGIWGDPFYVDPIFAYGPGYGGTTPQNCAIIGGTFYAPYEGGFTFPAQYADAYFFGDLCGRWIHTYNPFTGTTTPFATNTDGSQLVDMKMDPYNGHLYYATRGNSTLYIVYYTGDGDNAPGSPSLDGLLIRNLLPGSMTPATPEHAALADLVTTPASGSVVDQLFATQRVEQAPVATLPAERAALSVAEDVWQLLL